MSITRKALPTSGFAPAAVGDVVVAPVGELAAVLGSPDLSAVARTAVWRLDPTTTEIVGGTVNIPVHWASMHIDLYWCSASGTGDAVFRCDVGPVTEGAAAPDAPAGSQLTASATLATGVVRTRVKTGVAATPGLTVFEIVRLGGDAADTLVADAGVIAVVFSRAS